jgi:hypothetical protein
MVREAHTRRATNHAAKPPSFNGQRRQVICNVNDAAEAATASVVRRVEALEMAGGTLARSKKATISTVAGFT